MVTGPQGEATEVSSQDARNRHEFNREKQIQRRTQRGRRQTEFGGHSPLSTRREQAPRSRHGCHSLRKCFPQSFDNSITLNQLHPSPEQGDHKYHIQLSLKAISSPYAQSPVTISTFVNSRQK